MKGSLLMGGTLAVAVAMGFGLWYSINTAYYYDVTGVTGVPVQPDVLPVSNFRGIDADTSPLKMRACFDVDWTYFEDDAFKGLADPLVAPRWFDCFDAEQIAQDLEAGSASAILAQRNHPFGFDTFIAHYPDGRAYMWRQINLCGDAQFSGNNLPEGCEVPDKPLELFRPRADTPILLAPITGGDYQVMLTDDLTMSIDPDQPVSFRACFQTGMSVALLSETYLVADRAAPEPVDGALPCFDAGQISADVAGGEALALVSQRNIYPSIDRLVAVYDDGRAFAWHQYNDK